MTRTPARWATWGLLGAWTLHDLEEAVTMPGWTQRVADDLDLRGLAVVGHLVRRTRTEVWTAIALVGVPFAVAAAEGARTGGRSALYQGALLGYGLHAISHIGGTVTARAYTPGLVTTPVLVAGFSIATAAELVQRRVPLHPATTAVAMALGACVPLSHVIARRILRHRIRLPWRPRAA
ncbi:HXXEE domain-containing protein [Agrococcus baldri]|uniref:Membrane protein n=1 Tax=Agrococcus baldri TaxID=153730 RepID=A0AA87RJT7_9MICO|nr:HXXEE domain-containing protein [Agrococcus baldri]GEK79467.1 membrane protein [Agrococcus baldri]